MNSSERRRRSAFLLRLPFSLRVRADGLAEQDGISLNHFISLAVAEKVATLTHSQPEQPREGEKGAA
jgi:predicted HicB family RNase H-like nuclease